MKVLIVSLNSQYIHSSLAIWYLYASAKNMCDSKINLKVLEGTINEEVDDLYNRISQEKADVVAFSVYIWNIKTVIILAQKIKKSNPDIKIVLGGPEVSYSSDKVLTENKFIDFVLLGEGEETFPLLLNTINNKEIYENITALSYRKKGKIILGKPHISTNEPINPYCDEYLSSLKGRIAYLETSRGCPFSCAFCLSGRCGNVRCFNIDRAKSDIILLANSGSKIIKLVDRTFNANRKRAYEIFRFIIDNYGKEIPNDVCFHFEIAGDLLADDDFELLKVAPQGLIQFEIGVQSFNEKTLKAVNRITNSEKLINNIKRLTELKNIHTHIDLIAGLPFEDYKIFRKSFNIAYSLNADMLQLGFLKLLHGSSMRENIELFPLNFTNEPPYQVIDTPWLSDSDIAKLKACENALDRFVNSGRFLLTINYIFNTLKYNPFDTLTELGVFTGCDSCSLNEYVNKIYSFFSNKCDSQKLRDCLICDVASSVKNTVLPSSLIIYDKRLSNLKKMLETNPNTKKRKGVMRNVFLLYGKGCGAYVDYDKTEKGKYIVNKIDFQL